MAAPALSSGDMIALGLGLVGITAAALTRLKGYFRRETFTDADLKALGEKFAGLALRLDRFDNSVAADMRERANMGAELSLVPGLRDSHDDLRAQFVEFRGESRAEHAAVIQRLAAFEHRWEERDAQVDRRIDHAVAMARAKAMGEGDRTFRQEDDAAPPIRRRR